MCPQQPARHKPSAPGIPSFAGSRQSLGSDLRFVKDVLERPLEHTVDLCFNGDERPPPELLTNGGLGMLVERIEVTVRSSSAVQLPCLP